MNDGQHTIVGAVASESLDGVTFEQQLRSFQTHGVAANPTGLGGLVATAAAAPGIAAALGDSSMVSSSRGRPGGKALPAGMTVHLEKRKREDGGDVTEDADSWKGPWAAYEGHAQRKMTALESGQLTDAQKKLRLQQGYHPDKAGKLEKDAPTPVLTPAAPGATGGSWIKTVSSGNSNSSSSSQRPEASPTASDASSASSSSSAAAAAPAPAAASSHTGGKKGKGQTAAKSGTAALIEAGKGHVPGEASNAASSSSASAATGGRSAADEEAAAAAAAGEAVGIAGTSSTFHGKELFDYQGRSWMEAPKGLRADGGDHECFMPKKPIHKYTGE